MDFSLPLVADGACYLANYRPAPLPANAPGDVMNRVDTFILRSDVVRHCVGSCSQMQGLAALGNGEFEVRHAAAKVAEIYSEPTPCGKNLGDRLLKDMFRVQWALDGVRVSQS